MKYIFSFCVLLALSTITYSQGSLQENQNNIWTTYMNPDGHSYEELVQSFNEYWNDRPYQKGKGYKQFNRWQYQVKPRIYPSGDLTLPSSNYHNYMNWLSEQRSNERRVVPSSWTELGPFSKPTGADTGVGRLNMVRFDPTNSDIMYVGAPDGGLWKSTDAGATWTTNTDFLTVIGVSDLAIDPNNTDIMYLATGDIEGDRRSIGVLKSTDGGMTWNTTGLQWTATDNYRISKLLMDPTNSSILLAATDGGVFKTVDGAVNWSAPSVIHDFKDMEFKPSNPDTVYAAGTELYRSIDKGSTWTHITSGLPSAGSICRISLAVTPAEPEYVYALTGNQSDLGYHGLYRSIDGGTSFSTRSTSPNILGFETDGSDSGGQANYDLTIAVAPDDADFVTVGGINMWQSDDGGANWYIISFWDSDPSFEFVHADIHEVNYLPGNSTTFFACSDGGISKTTDDGVSWTDISNNLRISQQYALGQSASTDANLVSGLQDIGSIYTDGSWKVVAGGDGGDCFIDRTNDNNIVVSLTNGVHQLSTDGGMTFNDIVTGLPSGDGNAEFFSPIRQDPMVATRFYAGGRPYLYVSDDMGSTWSTTGNQPFGGDNIERFMVAPSDNTVIYAILFDAIAKSTDSGNTWSYVTGSLPVGSASLSNLTISNTDSDKVWVTFSGYDASAKVYQTTDGGSTWTNLSTGLPNLPANTIVYQNNSSNEDLYVGMDIGVYHIDNTSSTWSAFMNNIPNVKFSDLRILYDGDGKIRAGTYGRGAWESNLFTPLNDCPVDRPFSGTIASGTFGAQQTLTADETIGNGVNVLFQAGTEVTLDKEFEVILGPIFEVLMSPCIP